MNIWPRRVWVETSEGWASREPNFADYHRRRALEVILSPEYDDEAKEAARKEVENWEHVNHRMDESVRRLPVRVMA